MTNNKKQDLWFQLPTEIFCWCRSDRQLTQNRALKSLNICLFGVRCHRSEQMRPSRCCSSPVMDKLRVTVEEPWEALEGDLTVHLYICLAGWAQCQLTRLTLVTIITMTFIIYISPYHLYSRYMYYISHLYLHSTFYPTYT